MENIYKYTSETYTTTISVADYIAGFRDTERFMGYCKECHNYGKSWACPPYYHDLDEFLGRYKTVLLIAIKITPQRQDIPFSESGKLILPERKRIQKKLLEMEKEYNGYSFAYAGTCVYCPQGSCARIENQPCRHPELVRPSLEAYGFDIGLTTSKLFNIELKWGKDGVLPEYLTLVCGFFHNLPFIKSTTLSTLR